MAPALEHLVWRDKVIVLRYHMMNHEALDMMHLTVCMTGTGEGPEGAEV